MKRGIASAFERPPGARKQGIAQAMQKYVNRCQGLVEDNSAMFTGKPAGKPIGKKFAAAAGAELTDTQSIGKQR